MNRFGSAVILLIVTELILAYWATWVHATLGKFRCPDFYDGSHCGMAKPRP